MGTSKFGIRNLRRTRLAGCLAAALAVACGSADAASDRPSWWKRPAPSDIARSWQPSPRALPNIPAGAIVVQNCDDSGSGSLRDALATATSGDTIDLTQLSCSQITLTTGSLAITQPDITLQGPGAADLSISGNDIYSPLRQNVQGSLYVNDLTIEHGLEDGGTGDGKGGCIYGDQVVLTNSVVQYCVVTTDGSSGARGGGVYAFSGANLTNSSVIDSSAIAGPQAYGGGVFSVGHAHVTGSFIGGNYSTFEAGGLFASYGLVVSYSTFDSNNAHHCAGLCAEGGITIANSTISNNQATGLAGGALLYAPYRAAPVMILSSTVSGNSAYSLGGVLILRGEDIDGGLIANSTIAFNHEDIAARRGAGLGLLGHTVNGFSLESNIIANNTYGASSNPDDFAAGANVVITGANNLVGYSTVPLPSGTILGEDPLLAPLASNGGPTATHMLLSGSPAIDTGNNNAFATFDQRGTGYPRVVGSAPDIGAYELDAEDVVFSNGFDL